MKNKFIHFALPILMLSTIIMGCVHHPNTLLDGRWRGVFVIPDHEIPFLFEVKGSGDQQVINLINGKDRFELKTVCTNLDSISIPIELYDASLRFKVTDRQFNGRFFKLSNGKQVLNLPIHGEYGNLPRFTNGGSSASVSLQGTWDIHFQGSGSEGGDIGNFDQEGSHLTGTILTPTGDYRFLEGQVEGHKFKLSSFGGSSPILIEGELTTDSTLHAELITAKQATSFNGKRNAKPVLVDPYQLTQLKDGLQAIQFNLPNLEGKMVSLTDSVYRGKVVIVTLLGSWCPNCLDENTFLSEWYKQNQSRGVEIVGLGFERQDDFKLACQSLGRFRDRVNITYQLLFAGKVGTESVAKALPALKAVKGYPTTIFIDKKGLVRKIHTGFNGPATGKFYAEFQQEFNQLVDQLIKE